MWLVRLFGDEARVHSIPVDVTLSLRGLVRDLEVADYALPCEETLTTWPKTRPREVWVSALAAFAAAPETTDQIVAEHADSDRTADARLAQLGLTQETVRTLTPAELRVADAAVDGLGDPITYERWEKLVRRNASVDYRT